MSGYPSTHAVTADEFEDESVSYTTAGTVATSTAGAEAAMTSWAGVSTTYTFVNGYLYRVFVTGGAFNTDAAGTTATSIIRLRKGVNTTSGLQLLYTKCFSRGGSDVQTFANHGYIKNSSGADISTAIGVTVQRGTGAANNSLFGDANIILMVSVLRIGLVANLASGITGAAVAIV